MPGESHKRKVKAIKIFFNKMYNFDVEKNWQIAVDHEGNRELSPPNFGNRRPDFYAKRWKPKAIVVGEAKSIGDFNRSQEQVGEIISSLAEYHFHPTQPWNTAMILCIALNDIPATVRYVQSIGQAGRIPIHIIDETGFEHLNAYRR